MPSSNIQPVINSLAKEDWIALSTLMHRIDLTNIKNRSLKRRVLLTKNVLDIHLNTLNGHGTIDGALLLGSMKTLATLEKDFGENNHDFLLFMKGVVCKFETQRLLIDKSMEKKLEFKKMKGVIEI